MTSTTLSNKSFRKLFLWAFRRNRVIMIVFSILMLLGITGVVYMLFQLHSRETMYNENVDGMICSLGESALSVAQFLAIGFTFFSAVRTYSFLHNKRSIDMFGAFPATRRTMYLSHLLGGMVSVIVPYLVASLIIILLTLRTPDSFGIDMLMILFGLIGIIASYSFTAVIAYCCGTATDLVIITLASNVSFAGVVLVLYSMVASMIPGITIDSLMHAPIISLFSPYAFCFFADKHYFSGETASLVFILVWSVLFTAAMFAAGLFLSRKHKAEYAQGEVIVKWMPVVVKAAGSVICGGMIGIGAASSSVSHSGNMTVFIVWYLIVSAIAFVILHFIFSRGFKSKFIPSLIAYVCTTAVVLGLSFLMTTGLGIDTYVPDTASISCATIGYEEFRDPENIKTVTEIHRTITEGIHKEYIYPYYFGCELDSNDVYDYQENEYEVFQKKYPLMYRGMFTTHFVYNKSFGFTTERNYDLMYKFNNYDCDKIESLMQKLANSEEYKKSKNIVLWDKEKRSNLVPESTPTLVSTTYLPSPPYADGAQNDSYIDLPSDEKFLNGLYDVLAQDILADKEFYKHIIDTEDTETEEVDEFGMKTRLAIQISLRSRQRNDYSSYCTVSVQVPGSYTNTLRYLEDHHISTKGPATQVPVT